MESVAFFEKKVSLNAKDINKIRKDAKIDDILLKKLREKLENKCSEHGFVIPETLVLLSRSMGYFEPGRFTGDAVYYVKAEGKVYYPADGTVIIGEVLKKNKMGLYVTYKKGLRIQIPRDLHADVADEFEAVERGDTVEVELKKSLFQVNDPYILVNGLFLRKIVKEEAATTALELERKAEAESKFVEKKVADKKGEEKEEEEEEEEDEEEEDEDEEEEEEDEDEDEEEENEDEDEDEENE